MTTKPTATTRTIANAYALTVLPDPPRRPDAMQQRQHTARTDQVLRAHYIHRPDVLVSGSGYLCRRPGEARRSPNPDCLVSFGLNIPPEVIELEANGYTISEVGKPPEFVMEVGSETTGRRDYTIKRKTYAGFGVAEYWRFDHTGGRYHDVALAGDRLVGNAYEPIAVTTGADGVIRGYSPVLDLELHWQERRLRFWNPATGEYLPDLVDALAALASERAARMAAEAEVQRLRAELGR